MTAEDRLLRQLAPEALGAILRRYGDFEACEDAVQEALIAAARQWPVEGLPDNPRGWLIRVASRRRIEQLREDSARRRREESAVIRDLAEPDAVSSVDDTLTLFLLCCHPAISRASQLALTLRAIGGLTTAEIARSLLVPESTVAQRISRAKAKIKASGAEFSLPEGRERKERVRAVLQVLYLIFTEGSTASSGEQLLRSELSAEAIRLARQLHEGVPGDGEVAGLLALLLLTDARRQARADSTGRLVPLDQQDRSLWDAPAIAEGVALVSHALGTTEIGPYQVQAAIAAVHDEAQTPDDTDWSEILGLYELLRRLAPGPMVTLNWVVALAMVKGPVVGLAELARADADPALAGHYRVAAVRAHLLELSGERVAASASYLEAARGTLSVPERRYLEARARAASAR